MNMMDGATIVRNYRGMTMEIRIKLQNSEHTRWTKTVKNTTKSLDLKQHWTQKP